MPRDSDSQIPGLEDRPGLAFWGLASLDPRLPAIVTVAVAASALILAWLLRGAETRSLADATEAALRGIVSEAQVRVLDDVRSLERLGRRWEYVGGLSVEEFEAEARLLAADFDHLQAIEWADASLRVRWIVPDEGNEAARDLDQAFEERRRVALFRARSERATQATEPIDLVQGGKGFLTYVPLYLGDRFDGVVIGVTRIAPLLDEALGSVAAGYRIRVRAGGEEIYRFGASDDLEAGESAAELAILETIWEVSASPQPEVRATYRTWLPAIVALGGCANALFLGLAIHLARTSRLRAIGLLHANERLNTEVERRETAETAAKVARDELDRVLRTLPDHVWSGLMTSAGRLEPLYYSPVIGQIAGRPWTEFREDPIRWIEIVHQSDRERVQNAYQRCTDGSADRMGLEYRIVRPDGEERWVRDRVTVSRLDGGYRLDGVITDITEMKHDEEEHRRLEAGLQEAQKLESLGVLAGGVAHDFNNLLVGILGNARLVADDLPDDSPLRSRMAGIEKAGRAAAALCRQMLAYAGGTSLVMRTLDLRTVVSGIDALLGASFSKRHVIDFDFAPDTPAVHGDESQIRQIVMNLMINASEAIGDDAAGRIEVATRRVEATEAALAAMDFRGGCEPGLHAELRIEDDGCGMDELTRRRIFEPFFSQKFAGRGLGLAAVQGIVRAHHGALSVSSSEGEGTVVHVLFPAVEAAVEQVGPAAPEAETESEPVTVLLIDDDDDAREIGGQMLLRAGFQVLTAEDGYEGIEQLTARKDVRCIVLDLTMPGLGGVETYEQVQDLRPEVAVVLCSGYPAHAVVERFSGQGPDAFLEKPYAPNALIESVGRAIARARERSAGR